MQQDLKQKTKQLVQSIVQNDFKNNLGLLSGTSGSLFLLCYYTAFTNDSQYIDIAEQRISDTVDIINDDPDFSNLSYSSGITGFLWTLDNLREHHFIDIDLSDFKESIHPILHNYMNQKMDADDFDFLHGALGVANYFLNQTDENSQNWLQEFNKQLLSKATLHNDDTLSFTSTVYKDNQPVKVINFGLSHGMASIIYHFQNCLKHKALATPELKKALLQLIAFFRKNQNDLSVYATYFTNWIDAAGTKSNSRLGWCYGDLGIGVALLQAAETLNDAELKTYSLEVLKHTTYRLEMEKEGLNDAGICHGTAGLLKIYRNLFRQTNLLEFKNAGDYWLQKTLDQATHTSGVEGYKKFNQSGYENDYGLLEGTTGIGIVFLEELMNKSLPWEKALMLS